MCLSEQLVRIEIERWLFNNFDIDRFVYKQKHIV
jgi:hypothetical protein